MANKITAHPIELIAETSGIPKSVLILRSQLLIALTSEIRELNLPDDELISMLECSEEVLSFIKNGNITKFNNDDLLIYLSHLNYKTYYNKGTIEIKKE